MPVSLKGTLQQYAGRLHRAHASKSDFRILDYVDSDLPVLRRMWEKRLKGYRTMGYRLKDIEITRTGKVVDGGRRESDTT